MKSLKRRQKVRVFCVLIREKVHSGKVNRDQGSGIRDQGSVIRAGKGEQEMREVERRMARRKLDAEMKIFRQAARRKSSTQALLRAVRLALDIPVKEISEKMGVDRSVMYGLEESERKRTITLRSLGRMAEAMGCSVVYGVVPLKGKTLDMVADERMWRRVLGSDGRLQVTDDSAGGGDREHRCRKQGIENREQKSDDR
jgi:transcriptional regulator with XRE-family HTH domain